MKKLLYFSAFALIFSISCEDDNDQKSIDLPDDSNDGLPKNEIVYMVPSPNDQINALSLITDDFDQLLVNDLSSGEKYLSEKSVALNFGIYSTDLAYLMRNEQGEQLFIKYINVLESMGVKLGITQIYGEEILSLIDDSKDNPDEIYNIAGDNYLKVYDKMIENQKSAELSLILAGSWIETMHLLFNSAGMFSENQDLEDEITDQKYVLENLVSLMENSDNDNVNEIKNTFNELTGLYAQLDCQSTEVKVEKDSINSMTLYGGESCLFTEKTFNEMKSKIDQIRNNFIAQ